MALKIAFDNLSRLGRRFLRTIAGGKTPPASVARPTSARALSLSWDNIDPDIVRAQRAVCDRLGVKLDQHRIDGIDHGDWIDWTMNRLESVDAFLFIDADCVPLSNARVAHGFSSAAAGALYGAEGAANHIDPDRSYAGAWYVFVNRERWNTFGRPSAKATPFSDVCQLWTDTWVRREAVVELVAPTSCLQPRWDLPGRADAYGIGTTYGEDCFHLFESRSATNVEIFVDRCREVAAGPDEAGGVNSRI